MKNINNYIIEKLVLNKTVSNHIKWKKLIYDWINYWENEDFEYLMDMIIKFLDILDFDIKYAEDYEPLTYYKENKEFMKLVNQIFQKFKDDNDKQIEDLKNRN